MTSLEQLKEEFAKRFGYALANDVVAHIFDAGRIAGIGEARDLRPMPKIGYADYDENAHAGDNYSNGCVNDWNECLLEWNNRIAALLTKPACTYPDCWNGREEGKETCYVYSPDKEQNHG